MSNDQTTYDQSHWQPAIQCSKPDECQHPYCKCPRQEGQAISAETTHRWPTGTWLATRLFLYISVAVATGLVFVIGAGLWKVVSHG